VDNKDTIVTEREFERMAARIDDIGTTMGELAKAQAVMAEQMRQGIQDRHEMRAELAPLIAWAKVQMAGGLSLKVDTLEREVRESKAETKTEFQAIHADSAATRASVARIEAKIENIIRQALTYGSILGIVGVSLWAIFGDAVKDMIVKKVFGN
jgi:hypothetical protein